MCFERVKVQNRPCGEAQNNQLLQNDLTSHVKVCSVLCFFFFVRFLDKSVRCNPICSKGLTGNLDLSSNLYRTSSELIELLDIFSGHTNLSRVLKRDRQSL